MMATVIGPADRRRIIALSALAGAVVGVGLGFRTDLAIAVPPVMVTLAFLVPGYSRRRVPRSGCFWRRSSSRPFRFSVAVAKEETPVT
jgi:hypothetical protein